MVGEIGLIDKILMLKFNAHAFHTSITLLTRLLVHLDASYEADGATPTVASAFRSRQTDGQAFAFCGHKKS